MLFTLLTYSLIQLYLMKRHLTDLANKTIDSLRAEVKLGKDAVVVYYEKYFAILHQNYFIDIMLDLDEHARERMKKWRKYMKEKWGD